MKIILPLVAILALSPQIARAEKEPGPSHVKVAQCAPTHRVELTVLVGHPLVITFPHGESTWLTPMSGKADPNGKTPIESTIEGVKAEEIKDLPMHNLTTLWPDAPGVTTLTVIAQDAAGDLKTYPFTLTAIADDPEALADPSVTLNLLCQAGPVGTAAAARPVAGVQHAPVPITYRRPPPPDPAAAERLRVDAFNTVGAPCHYSAKGKRPSAVQPSCPMDNGQWTLFRFRGLTRKPAIYVGACETANDERLARQHEQADFVVVEEIAPRFCLRLGSAPNEVLEIINDAYDPVGRAPNTGTLSPDVRRDLIQAKSNGG